MRHQELLQRRARKLAELLLRQKTTRRPIIAGSAARVRRDESGAVRGCLTAFVPGYFALSHVAYAIGVSAAVAGRHDMHQVWRETQLPGRARQFPDTGVSQAPVRTDVSRTPVREENHAKDARPSGQRF